MLFDPCKKIIRRLSAYHDGELSPRDREAVKGHLAGCAACTQELRRVSAVDPQLKLLPGAAPQPFFAARVTAAARARQIYHGPFRRFVLYPVPAAAALTAFIIFNIFTFAFNINALENGPRRELARKVVTQLAKPASLLNPVAVARLCGECSKYMCLCMHEAGKAAMCPCQDCEMEKAAGAAGPAENTEGHHVD